MFHKIEMFAIRMAIAAQSKVRDFVKKENGDVNIVSIVVLIGIAVVLAIIFRKQISDLINNLFNTIGNNANDVIKNNNK